MAADDDFELDLTDRYLIAGVEHHTPANSLPIDQGSIRTPEIPQTHGEFIHREDAMMPTDQITVRAQMAVLLTSNQKFSKGKGNDAPRLFPTDDSKFSLSHGRLLPDRAIPHLSMIIPKPPTFGKARQ